MRIAILGADGLLGRAIRAEARAWPDLEVIAAGRQEADVTDPAAVAGFVDRARPDVVLNLAAMMPADRCEVDPAPAYAVNSVGAGIAADAAERASAAYALLSTDFVFSGDTGTDYRPTDVRTPRQVYGYAKALGEDAALTRCSRTTVIRTASLYRRPRHPGCGRIDLVNRTLDTLKRAEPMRIVDDVVMSPTFVEDAAVMVIALLHHPPGVYHAVNQGAVSWYELCAEAAKLAGLDANLIEPVPISELPPPAVRPRRAALSTRELPSTVPLRGWQEALQACLRAT